MAGAPRVAAYGSMRSGAYVIGVLCLGYLIAFADRAIIALLIPGLKSSLRLTDTQVSLLQGVAFATVFAVAGLAIGRIADRANRRNLLVAGMVLWSLATIACGLASSFAQLFVARMFVGLGEACLTPAAVSLVADYFQPAVRGRVMGLIQAGNPFGNTLALVGGGVLLSALSHPVGLGALTHGIAPWKVVFVAAGAPALVVAGLTATLREPPRREAPSQTAGGLLKHMGEAPLAFVLFFSVPTAATIVGYAVNSWAPTILMRIYHLSPAQAGALFGFSILIHAPLAGFVGGLLSDGLSRRRPSYGRALIPALALPVVIVGLIGFLLARDIWTLIVALSVTLFAANMVTTSAFVALQELFPNRLRGRAVALFILIGNLMGFGLAPTLVALVNDRGFGDEMKLQASVGLVSLGAACMGFLLALALPKFYARAARSLE